MDEEMIPALLNHLQELHQQGQYSQIVQRLSRIGYDDLPDELDVSMTVEAVLHTFGPSSDEEELWQAATVIWQLERRGFLDQNELDKIAHVIGEAFQKADRKIPFCLGRAELIRQLQQLHAEGQYLQILRQLLQYTFIKLPAGLDVPMAVEAIVRTFQSSSDEVDLRRASVLKSHLEHEKLLTPGDADRISAVVLEAFLKAEGETPSFLLDALVTPYDRVAAEDLIRIYTRATTREARFVLARWIGAFHKEAGLLVLVDNLYAQQILANDSIRAILEKHPLLGPVELAPEECDTIISAVLEFLEVPGHKVDTSDEEKKYDVESTNRTSAARILVALNGYPNTWKRSRARIRRKGNLIVMYHCVDRMYDSFWEVRLSRYLSGHIN